MRAALMAAVEAPRPSPTTITSKVVRGGEVVVVVTGRVVTVEVVVGRRVVVVVGAVVVGVVVVTGAVVVGGEGLSMETTAVVINANAAPAAKTLIRSRLEGNCIPSQAIRVPTNSQKVRW
jgi:hypothetical protein